MQTEELPLEELEEAVAAPTRNDIIEMLDNALQLRFGRSGEGEHLLGVIEICGLEITQGWQPIEKAEDYKTYLVQHHEDIFPTAAYKMPGNDGGWFYQQDGPEDVIEEGDHSHKPLKRPPTHFKELGYGPLPPVQETSND